MAHPRHAEVRQWYNHCCGYCGVSESESAGELTVDHYRPVAAGGDDSDDNLVYACFRCNTYKGDFFPNEADILNHRRVLHPFLDLISSHFRENEQTGFLEALTDTGRFHLLLLRLNRPQLVELRLQRRLIGLLTETAQLLRDENQALHRRVALLEDYLHLLLWEAKRSSGKNPPEPRAGDG